MGRVAILKIGYGNFEQGFEVSLEIKEDQGQSLVEIEGKLPANTDIENLYQSWQQSFYHVTGISRRDANWDWDIDDSITTNIDSNHLVKDCWQKVQALEANMRSWLQPSADINWQKIRERLAQELARHSPEIRLIIKAREEKLWKFPWHEWDLLTEYPDVGIGYSTSEYDTPLLKPTALNQVRILAVFGDSQNIDLTEDKQAINNLKDTEPVFLLQPNSRTLIKTLRDDQGWDIFFFAGHSQSESSTGRIYLSETESLTNDQFKNSLTEAISQGLKIAIFNSCDGLKLAQRMADLNIPIVIVMQEIVPDLVAQSFLKEFLSEYNLGKPLYTAVRRAQARLEEFTNYPGATWLPLIFQNPTVIPPQWHDFLSATSEKPSKLPLQSRDWGDAPDISFFYGRTDELTILKQWIVEDNCRLITFLGMGGMGKTSLTAKIAHLLEDEFELIIWRSLRNAPTVTDILAELIQFLSQQTETALPENLDARILRLLEYLRTSRCLLVLDNAESILQSGIRMGKYQSGYEGYGQLIKAVGETNHLSCLLLTSREKTSRNQSFGRRNPACAIATTNRYIY